MSGIAAAELEALRAICGSATLLSDAGRQYISLPALKITVGGEIKTLDGLLCPQAADSYTTRLYLSQAIPERRSNWTAINILGRTWHTWSWNNVPANIPLVQMLLAHVGALR